MWVVVLVARAPVIQDGRRDLNECGHVLSFTFLLLRAGSTLVCGRATATVHRGQKRTREIPLFNAALLRRIRRSIRPLAL
jgi:hypothetical protein